MSCPIIFHCKRGYKWRVWRWTGIRFKDYLISWFSQFFGIRNIKVRWQGAFTSDFWLLWWLGRVCDVYELVDLFCSCGVVVLQPLVSHWATLISPNYFLLHSVLVPGILILVVVSSTFCRIWHCRRVLRTPPRLSFEAECTSKITYSSVKKTYGAKPFHRFRDSSISAPQNLQDVSILGF